MDVSRPQAIRSLSGKLIRSTVLLAFVLGFLVSAIQIVIDFRKAERQPDLDMEALFSLIREPATAILYTLDSGTADELLSGTLRQPAIRSSRLMRAEYPSDKPLAARERPLIEGRLRIFSDWLLGAVRHYKWALYSKKLAKNDELLGALEVYVDTYSYGEEFIERSMVTVASTLLYALLISTGLLFVFHLQVSKPLISVIRSIAEVDVDHAEAARLYEPSGHADTEIGLLVRLTNQHLQAIGNTLEQLRLAEEGLKRYMDELELKVTERTRELSDSVSQLQAAQAQLIQSEKLAALGGLVAGVAHEVNTPLGIAVTASSVLNEVLEDLNSQFAAQTLSSASFKSLLEHALDSNLMLFNNIRRAAKLIGDFKQTAVDQVSEARNEFMVYQALGAMISSLRPETRKVPVEPLLICPQDLRMNSLPGVLTQVLANLILNSVRHAFADAAHADITITLQLTGDQVILDYRDNGAGVPLADQERIFEPFFTTKRGHGGSGLGLNIVYNLVTRKLGGRLEFDSQPGEGVHFKLSLPQKLP